MAQIRFVSPKVPPFALLRIAFGGQKLWISCQALRNAAGTAQSHVELERGRRVTVEPAIGDSRGELVADADEMRREVHDRPYQRT